MIWLGRICWLRMMGGFYSNNMQKIIYSITNYMMRKKSLIFSILLFIFSNTIKAQLNSTIVKDHETKANHYESKHDYISAINLHYFILENDTLESGKKAEAAIENLLPKCRELVFKQLQGKWELKKKLDFDYYSNIKYTKFIEIENDKIIFYDIPGKIVSEINLKTNPFSYHQFGGFPSLKLEQEIWTFSTRIVHREKRLRLRKHIDKNGNLVGNTDDRAAIVDSLEREKALQKEIDTYYIKR
ncbi:hypothetical protein NZ698_16420 [Chryseobacterium sp. PBS4-4]|uniref:GLPGLI family protein n=1 Tax=Chryseobacterium edaphi TaxID=2976532 RepID=A0ABT2W9B9_9FLAO|nr:hypothetical protein [Chryseobacterium edaphi]MCU7618781.1 hypothetical protein [Chryseobacterium edaphi]